MIDKIMTKDIIVGDINNNIYEIANIMKKYDIGFLPIAKRNKIVGVITDRDIVVKCLANKDINTIDDYMNKTIISLPVNTNIENVLKVMGQEQIKRILITDNKKLIGIISLSDIINSESYNEETYVTFKKIYKIKKNNDYYKTEIDEFYL